MPKVKADGQGRLVLPEEFLKRRHIPSNMEYWLDGREGDLILRPCLPDVRKLYVEPTTSCNLHCRTCVRNIWEEPESQISMNTFQRVVESLTELTDVSRVVFSGFGEPLVHPEILQMIEAVRERDIAVTVGSNGLLLNADMARELVRLGVDRIVVSMDGVRPETYANIRGATLLQVLDNIRILLC